MGLIASLEVQPFELIQSNYWAHGGQNWGSFLPPNYTECGKYQVIGIYGFCLENFDGLVQVSARRDGEEEGAETVFLEL